MVRSLIDTYRHVGWLPDCRMSLSKGFTQVGLLDKRSPMSLLTRKQGGSNADVVLADAYLKGIGHGINARTPTKPQPPTTY